MPTYIACYRFAQGGAEQHIDAETHEAALAIAQHTHPDELTIEPIYIRPLEISVFHSKDDDNILVTWLRRAEQSARAAMNTSTSLREAILFIKRGKPISAYRCFMDAVHFAVEAKP